MAEHMTEIGDTSPSSSSDVEVKTSTKILYTLQSLPSKGSYVFMHGIVGTYQPYLILFFKSIGLSIPHAGIIIGFRLIVSCVSTQCCNAIGRYTRYNRCLFWLACVFTILSFTPMPWIANSKVLSLKFQSGNVNCTTSFMQHRTQIGDSHGISECIGNTTQIYTLFFVMLSMNLGNSAIECIIPGYTRPVIKSVIESLGQTFHVIHDNLYNAIGYGSATLISGISLDYYKPIEMSHYTPIFYVYLGFSILMIITSVFLFEQFTTNPEENEASYRMILQTCSKHQTILFITTVVGIGVANGFLCSFLFVILDEMKSTKTMMGLSTLMSCVTEFVVFLLSRRVATHTRKPLHCICLCLFQYFLRFLCISYMTKSWMIIPIQLLNIFGFPLFWVAVLDYIRIISPMQSVDSMHNLMYFFHYVVGGVIANITGGVLYSTYEGKVWYRWVAVIYLLWSVIAIVYVRIMEKATQKRELRINSFSSQNNLANHSISEIKDKILLDDDVETVM